MGKKEGLKKAEAAIKSKVDEKLLQKHQGSEDKKVSNLLQKGDDNDEDKGGSGLSDIVGAAKSGLKGAKAAIMKKAEAAKSGLKEAGAAIMKKGEAAIKEKIEEVKKEGLKKAEAATKSKIDEKLLQKRQGSEDKKVSDLLQKGDDNDEDKGGSGFSDIVGAAKSGLKGAGAIIKKGEAAIKEKIEEGEETFEGGGSNNKEKD